MWTLARTRMLIACLLVSLALTVGGLWHSGYVHRSMVDPDHPPYLSTYVQGRGFPFVWLVTDRSQMTAGLERWRRFLALRFLVSWVFNMVPVGLVWVGARRLRSRARTARP